MIINFLVGQRTLEDGRLFIDDLLTRIVTKPLFTSDELAHYKTILAEKFSSLEEQPRTGKRGRPRTAKRVIDPELKYATVHKIRKGGKITKVSRTIVFGNPESIQEVLASSRVSKKINTSFIERVNLTLRNFNKKLARKTLCFAKQERSLEAQVNITVTYYNFSLYNRSLTLRGPKGKRVQRTPAMAASIIERAWPLTEILAYPLS